jgi:hypothetical protein
MCWSRLNHVSISGETQTQCFADYAASFKTSCLIRDFLKQYNIPKNVRFDALILAMKAYGLPSPPEPVQNIRKYWLECVEEKKLR